jgi:hypothetical protein
MKITHIDAQNVLGIRAASVALNTPITLFAGPNGNGKSSLAEAVRMALCGDVAARGVTLKKDLAALVHEGAKNGAVEVELEGGLTPYALVPSGKTPAQDVYVPHRALPYVLEPHRFAALDGNGRRSFLFGLLGIGIKAEEVIERLAKRGVDEKKALRVGPLLKAGFDAACDEAKRKATEAKGAWRQVTGEAYGSEKAKTWAAPVPAYDAEAFKTLSTELQHLEHAQEQWQQTIGRLAAQEQRRAEIAGKLPALVELAGKVDRIEKKLAADRKNLAEAERQLAEVTAAAGQSQRDGLIHDLAAAVAYLLPLAQTPVSQEPPAQECDAEAALNAYEREHGRIGAVGDPAAAARLPEVRASRDLMDTAVANSQRDLAAALRARDEAAEISEQLKAEFDGAALASARAESDKLKAARGELLKKLETLRIQKAAAEVAQQKTEAAAGHHADVVAWDLIAQALAPDGIPGELLSEALTPFNQRLEQSARDAEWPVVKLDADMAVTTTDGRPYRLLSESEKWRADAMLAEAISYLSGLKVLLLDRIDVLDLKGREDLFAWLDILAAEGEIGSALLFGTLKSIPADLRPTVSGHWLQGGVVQQLKAAA